MSNSNYVVIRKLSEELEKKLKNNEGTFLFTYDIVDYYLVDKTIVKTWIENPNENIFFTKRAFSEVPLSYFKQIIKNYREYLKENLKEKNSWWSEERVQATEEMLDKAEELIRPLEKEISERDHGIEVNETSKNLSKKFKELCSVIQKAQELGMNENWTITRNDEIVFNTNPDQEMKL